MTARALALAALAAGGCTLSPGGWFADLEPSLEAGWDHDPARDQGGGWQRLATDYEVRLLRGALEIEGIELVDTGTGGALGFDPAKPPPGYSLCHNGHCHRDDGALVSYEEVEAELAGASGGGATTVVILPVGEVDLLAPGRRHLACEPGCGLPLAHVGRARITIRALVLEGEVRDGRATPRLPGIPAWRLSAAGIEVDGAEVPALVIEAPLELPADRRHPPRVRLDLTLAPGPRALDAIDWAAAAAPEGAIDLDTEENDAARRTALAGLEESPLGAAIRRSDR